jgi:hypothetical protein
VPAGSALRSVAFGSRFAAVGNGGTTLLSSDGKTWTAAVSGASNTLNSVTFGNARFSAVGAAGTNLTSL